MIHHIQNNVGMPSREAIFNRCQISRRIEKGTVLFLNNHRNVMVIRENADRTVTFRGEPFLTHLGYRVGKAVLIKTFAQGIVEDNTKAAVNPLDLLKADRHELLPKQKIGFIARVQARSFSEYGLVQIRVFCCERSQHRVVPSCRNPLFCRLKSLTCFTNLGFELLQFLLNRFVRFTVAKHSFTIAAHVFQGGQFVLQIRKTL